jgi:RNA recognition motif-containing protein
MPRRHLEPFVGKKLYVGNLSYDVSKDDLQRVFASHGTVVSAQVITERETGRSKGFGFVEMGSDQEAQAAIAALNGTPLGGRNLTVNEARQQVSRGGGPRGDGGGGFGRGRGGFGGRGRGGFGGGGDGRGGGGGRGDRY